MRTPNRVSCGLTLRVFCFLITLQPIQHALQMVSGAHYFISMSPFADTAMHQRKRILKHPAAPKSCCLTPSISLGIVAEENGRFYRYLAPFSQDIEGLKVRDSRFCSVVHLILTRTHITLDNWQHEATIHRCIKCIIIVLTPLLVANGACSR